MKVLLCGDVLPPAADETNNTDPWTLLIPRLNDLQKSSNGPFELLIFTGRLFFRNQQQINELETHFQQVLKITVIAFSALVEVGGGGGTNDEEKAAGNQFQSLQLIPSASPTSSPTLGFWNSKEGFSIAYYHPRNNISTPTTVTTEVEEEEQQLSSIVDRVGYHGCDFLISSPVTFPLIATSSLPSEQITAFQQTSVYSQTVRNRRREGEEEEDSRLPTLVNRLKPRYLFLSGCGGFYQRPAFPVYATNKTPNKTTTTTEEVVVSHYCRMIALDKVSSRKEKGFKYLHALSLNPLIFMKKEDLINPPPPDATANPFLPAVPSNTTTTTTTTTTSYTSSAVYQQQQNRPLKQQREEGGGGGGGEQQDGGERELKRLKGSSGQPVGALAAHFVKSSSLPPPPALHLPPPPPPPQLPLPVPPPLAIPTSATSSSFFFGGNGGGGAGVGNGGSTTDGIVNPFSKKTPTATSNTSSSSVDPNNCTLFVGNLPMNFQEKDLKELFPNAIQIKKIANKSFAFINFQNHLEAENYLKFFNQSNQRTIHGKLLTVKWGNQPNNNNTTAATTNSTTNTTSATTLGGGSGGGGSVDETILIPPHEDSKSLYIGNILSFQQFKQQQQKEGKEQATPEDYESQVKVALQQLFPTAMHLSFRLSSSSFASMSSSPTFAFVEFHTHREAMEVLQDYFDRQSISSTTTTTYASLRGGGGGSKYQVLNQPIILKWSKTTSQQEYEQQQQQSQQHHQPHHSFHHWNNWNLLNEQPNDCKVIFIGHLPLPSEEKEAEEREATMAEGEEKSNEEKQQERLSRLKTLLIHDYHLHEDYFERNEIISLHQPEGRDYGFLECNNPLTASKIMKQLIGAFHSLRKRLDGQGNERGVDQQADAHSSSSISSSSSGVLLKFGWAKGKNADKQIQSQDCWFCLASPSVKVR